MPKEKTKKPIARRVIKQGSSYICGICGRVHRFPQTAEDCVERCFENYVNKQETVSEEPASKGRKYRCTFCKRIYPTLSKAKECVAECKKQAAARRKKEKAIKLHTNSSMSERAKQLAQISQQAAEQWNPSGESLSSKVAKRGLSYVCLRCHSLYPTIREAKDCADRHMIKPTQSYAERVAKAKSSATAKRSNLKRETESKEIFEKKIEPPKDITGGHNVRAPKASLADDDEMYKREGSNYTCKLCGKKYFTRNEVVNCFKSHKGVPVKQNKRGGITLEGNSDGKNPNFAIERAKKLGNVRDADKFLRDGAKYFCKACGKGYFTKNEVISCFDSHLAIKEEKVEEQEEVQEGYTLAEDAGLPEKNKFKRDGAKYVCRKCSRKYYTRVEVVECFNYDCPEILPSQAK